MKRKLPEHTDTALADKADAGSEMARVTKLGSKCSRPQGSHPGELIIPTVGHAAQRKQNFTDGSQTLKNHTDGQHF